MEGSCGWACRIAGVVDSVGSDNELFVQMVMKKDENMSFPDESIDKNLKAEQMSTKT